MSNTTQPSHGGPRPGSGRKRKFDSLVRCTVTLTPQDFATLKLLGNGNVSAGIRKAIEAISATQTE